MPNARVHDTIGLLVGVLAVIPVLLSVRLYLAVSGLLGFAFATYMFNGDLDLYSEPYQRWWILRWLWYPYRRFLPHRSMLSHGPIIGTVMRLLYLCFVLTGPMILMCHLAGLSPAGLWAWIQTNQTTVLSVIAGIEVGSLVHTITDVISTWSKRTF